MKDRSRRRNVIGWRTTSSRLCRWLRKRVANVIPRRVAYGHRSRASIQRTDADWKASGTDEPSTADCTDEDRKRIRSVVSGAVLRGEAEGPRPPSPNEKCAPLSGPHFGPASLDFHLNRPVLSSGSSFKFMDMVKLLKKSMWMQYLQWIHCLHIRPTLVGNIRNSAAHSA